MDSIMKPFFSVIMPVYNGELYLKAAIDSLLNQTFTDWELIVVDDGSTDNSVEILKGYEENDKRIKLICQKHIGFAGAARNTAIQYVSGKYIELLDCDDWISNDLLNENFNRIQNTNADIIIPYAVKINNEGTRLYDWKPYKNDFDEIITGMKAFELSLDWKIFGCGCFRTSLFKKVGSEKTLLNGDEFTTRKLFANSKIVTFSKGTYFYRFNENSTTLKKYNVKMYDQLETLNKLILYCNEVNAPENCIRICCTNFLVGILTYMKKYFNEKNNYSNEDSLYAIRTLKNSYSHVNRKILKFCTKKKLTILYILSLDSFNLFKGLVKIFMIIF